ncbi:PA14 domain-containing protein, partial [Acinetobacter baumannii]
QDPSGSPTAQEVDPQVNFNWNGNSPIAGVGGSNWAGDWSGQIQAETTGTYTLTTKSDDGVRVYINGQLVIDDYTYHAPTYDSATLN